jgi:hypothetical protein
MNLNTELLYGAFACVSIRFDGDLKELSKKLALVLNLKSFDVEPSEEPPHEMIGMSESLGWEAWLKSKSGMSAFNYHLEIQTEHSFNEHFEGRMHDLSPWFARLLRDAGNLDVVPAIKGSSG